MPNRKPVIELRGVGKTFTVGGHDYHALRSIDLTVRTGEFVAITGPSGCGKSTMLQILGCLDRPSRGTYHLGGEDVAGLSNDQLAGIRLRRVGFVFQSFHLLPKLSVLDNVELPLIYASMARKKRRERAAAALERVGLAERLEHNPLQLSGGERQRVAIARSIVNDPDVVLADEPTGNLDSNRGAEILALFEELHAMGKTVVLITHDASIAASTGRIVRLKDGEIVGDDCIEPARRMRQAA